MESNIKSDIYGKRFFEEIADGSLSSAQVIVPLLMELLTPKSVLDVGCAEGAWLSVFKTHGVDDCHGTDGTYVDQSRLLIDPKCFSASDLEKPFSLGRRFDLVICLEVAEHLSPAVADQLINSLVAHADCVVFSASAPCQDGTGHVNEQWPAYWAEKFRNVGYNAYDCIRSKVWNDGHVRWWFAQNTIVYATPKFAANKIGLGEQTYNPLPLVHPELFLHKERRLHQIPSLRSLLKQTGTVFCATMKRRLLRVVGI